MIRYYLRFIDKSSSQSSSVAASTPAVSVRKLALEDEASGSTSGETRQESPEAAEIRRRRLEKLERRDDDDLD